jgi:hypothetical protein
VNKDEMRDNAIAIVKHIAREAPEAIGVVVLFYDRTTRTVVMAGSGEEAEVRDMISIALSKPLGDNRIIRG